MLLLYYLSLSYNKSRFLFLQLTSQTILLCDSSKHSKSPKGRNNLFWHFHQPIRIVRPMSIPLPDAIAAWISGHVRLIVLGIFSYRMPDWIKA